MFADITEEEEPLVPSKASTPLHSPRSQPTNEKSPSPSPSTSTNGTNQEEQNQTHHATVKTYHWVGKKDLNLRLIEIYKKHQSKFSSAAYSGTKCWKIIAEEIKEFIPLTDPAPTPQQCKTRWNTMDTTYKT